MKHTPKRFNFAIEKMDTSEIRELVRSRMKKENLSLRRTARSADVDPATLCRLLKGKAVVEGTLVKLEVWLSSPMRKIERKTIQTKNGPIRITIEAD